MSFTTRRLREEEGSRGVSWTKTLRWLLVLHRPVLGWYRAWKERKEEDERHRVRLAILKRIAVILVSVLVVLLLLAGALHILFTMKIVTMNTFLSVAATELPADSRGYTNVLLLGKGDESHDGVDLTDTVMIASLDARRTKSALLLSLPRDLYLLSTEKMGEGRLNELYRNYKHRLKRDQDMTPEAASQEALKELAREVSRTFQVDIHHVLMVDFIGFVKAVDAVGGLDIDVPYDIVDVEYPGPNYSYQTFRIQKGLQHIDGETALKYARSRHTTSDFGRSARQQQMIATIGEKAKTLGIITSPGKLKTFWDILRDHTETTMSFSELLGAAKLGKEIDRAHILTVQLSNGNGLFGEIVEPGGFLYNPPREEFAGASVLLPVSIPPLPVTWRQIRLLVRLLQDQRALYLRKPEIRLLNGGARSGLGQLLGNELTRFNLQPADISNATDRSRQTSFIFARGAEDIPDATVLATLLHLPLQPAPADILPEEKGAVTIVLGKDYEYRPLQEIIPLDNF